ncbi:MAG: hypothetical protein JWO38_3727, partial [Gemmataceae bacterium]|nr:hypothetical protein [Gemmataceae bacterium]
LVMAGAVVVADGPGGPGPAAGPAAAAPEKDTPRDTPDRLRFVAVDGFDGRLGLNWKPVRPDGLHVSLRKHPGRLTITTQKGTIHEQTEKDDPALAARNIYLIDNPLAPGGDFVAATCLVGFRPTAEFHQAGLILYDDDDNYLKWVEQYNWKKEAGECFALVVETGGKRQPKYDHTDADPGLDKVWLRLTKRGNTYDCAVSTDGVRFVTHTTAEWGKGGPKRLGLIAKNGGRDVPEIDAQFEFFELRAP